VTFLGLHDVKRFMSEPGATKDGLKLAFTFLMTTRGIPMIYYGDEIGMPGGDDPDNRRDFPGGWKQDQRNAFTREERTPDEEDIFEHVRRLAHLRLELRDLRTSGLTELALSNHAWAYSRGRIIVALNNGATPESLDCPAPAGHWRDALSNLSDLASEAGRVHLTLPAKSAAILVPNRTL
jgi:glycosidase